MLKKANARAIIELFQTHIYKYKDKILTKDESFFIDNNYSELTGGGSSSKILAIVHKLKQYWNCMSDNTKDSIWKYFNVFIVLCDRYYNTTNTTTSQQPLNM